MIPTKLIFTCTVPAERAALRTSALAVAVRAFRASMKLPETNCDEEDGDAMDDEDGLVRSGTST